MPCSTLHTSKCRRESQQPAVNCLLHTVGAPSPVISTCKDQPSPRPAKADALCPNQSECTTGLYSSLPSAATEDSVATGQPTVDDHMLQQLLPTLCELRWPASSSSKHPCTKSCSSKLGSPSLRACCGHQACCQQHAHSHQPVTPPCGAQASAVSVPELQACPHYSVSTTSLTGLLRPLVQCSDRWHST